MGSPRMGRVDRISVSLDAELLAAFDRYILQLGYVNRSEAIRDLIRRQLGEARESPGAADAAGVLTFFCNRESHEAWNLIRGEFGSTSSPAEVLTVRPIEGYTDWIVVPLRGPAERIRSLSERVGAIRGVTHARFVSLPIIPDERLPDGKGGLASPGGAVDFRSG